MHEVAVPQGVYRHLQYGFVASNARWCAENRTNLKLRVFHPGGLFIHPITRVFSEGNSGDWAREIYPHFHSPR